MNPRRYWAAVLTAAVTVSVAGNVGHALLTAPEALRTPAAVAAALPPLALLAVTEGLMRVAGHGHRRWAYRAGVAGAVAIAMIAFVLSFAALRDLAIMLGQPSAVAAGWPLLADAAIAVASVMLLATKPVAATVTDQLDAPAMHAESALIYPDSPAWFTAELDTTTDIELPAMTYAGLVATSPDAGESLEETVMRMANRGDSQRTIGAATGKSQATISRIISAARAAAESETESETAAVNAA